jgi:hypothetical protein
MDANPTEGDVFEWYHPNSLVDYGTIEGSNNANRTDHARYTTKYYIDFSSEEPIEGDPTDYESMMITKELIWGNGTELNFQIYGGENDVRSDYIDIANDEDLGTGEWFWRIRGVI